jgi:lipopolysaccharide transport system permease protein
LQAVTATPALPPHVVIRPSRGWRSLDLRELWQYRELVWIFAWRDLKVRYRQTILGAAWVIAQPLVAMVLFTLVFHRIARIETFAGVPYSVFVLAGLLLWNFFTAAVNRAGNSLIGASYLISKVYFPRLAIPFSGTIVDLFELGVSATLLVALMAWYQIVPGLTVLLLPFIVLLTVLLAMGIGFWAAALNVEYRDFRVLLPFVMQVAMFATPVVYPLSALPAKFRPIAVVNPMTGIVEGARAVLFGTDLPLTALLVSVVWALLSFVTGVYYFRRMERLFADLL